MDAGLSMGKLFGSLTIMRRVRCVERKDWVDPDEVTEQVARRIGENEGEFDDRMVQRTEPLLAGMVQGTVIIEHNAGHCVCDCRRFA